MPKRKFEPEKNKAKKRGRPFKLELDERTLTVLSGLGELQVTTIEASTVFGVSEPTFLAFLKREPEARRAFENGKLIGRVSLRQTQFKLAERNARMAIFLGKVYLDQTDRAVTEKAPVVALEEVEKRLREQIAALRDDELKALIAEAENPPVKTITMQEQVDGSYSDGRPDLGEGEGRAGNSDKIPRTGGSETEV